MARLQFRVWDKEQNKMLYDDFIIRHGNDDHKHAEPIEELDDYQSFNIRCIMGDVTATYSLVDWSNFYFENYVTMQCTGFHDKNGQLIWEGDLLKFGDIIYPVHWYYCNYIWNGQMIADFRDFDEQDNEIKTDILKGYQGDVFGIQTVNMEKVGNIYEHGEQYGFNKESIDVFTPSYPI